MVGTVVGEDEFYRIAVGNPNESLTKEVVAALVHGVVPSKAFTQMGMESYLIATASLGAESDWVQDCRRRVGHKGKVLPGSISLHCCIGRFVIPGLAHHVPHAA